MLRISSLYIYPVKSLKGIAVAQATVDARGFQYDRHFMLVDLQGRFVTQREVPMMATIATDLTEDMLLLSHSAMDEIRVALSSDQHAETRKVNIWKHSGLVAEDCGDEVANWLSLLLQGEYRLVRAGSAFERRVTKTGARPADTFGFADGAPLLVCSEASLETLNRKLQDKHESPLPIDRFRPNIVVSGCMAHAEDEWKEMHADTRAGTIVLQNAGPSERCSITTTDQSNGTRDKERLKTLADYRRLPQHSNGVFFGCNYINRSKQGMVRVGDTFTITSD